MEILHETAWAEVKLTETFFNGLQRSVFYSALCEGFQSEVKQSLTLKNELKSESH